MLILFVNAGMWPGVTVHAADT